LVFRNQNNTLLFVIFQGYRIPIREGCDEQLAGHVLGLKQLPCELSGFEIEGFFTFTASERAE
jgi:hypothetical protein